MNYFINESLVECLKSLEGLVQVPYVDDNAQALSFLADLLIEETQKYKNGREKDFRYPSPEVEYTTLINLLVLEYIHDELDNIIKSPDEILVVFKFISNEYFAYMFYSQYALKYNVDKFFESFENSCFILLKNLVGYYDLEMTTFKDYEKCIRELCGFYGKVRAYCKYAEKNILEYDDNNVRIDFEEEFLRVLYRALSYAGESNDTGYAFNGIKEIRDNIGQLDEDIVIKILERYLSERTYIREVNTKQIYNIINYSRTEMYDKDILKFFYIDNSKLMNSIDNILMKYIYDKYKEYVGIFEIYSDSFNRRKNVETINLKDVCQYIVYDNDGNEFEKVEFYNNKMTIGYSFRDIFKYTAQFNKDKRTIELKFLASDNVSIVQALTLPYDNEDYNCRYIKQSDLNKLSEELITMRFKFMISYLWIENLNGVIDKQGFNFENKYKFHYDYDNEELKCEERENPIPDNFFSNSITNLNALIGKNGTGKTSIINFIKNDLFQNISKKDNTIKTKFVAVIYYGDKYFWFSNIEGEIKINCCDSIEILKMSENFTFQDSKIVFFSNVINYNERYSNIENDNVGLNSEEIYEEKNNFQQTQPKDNKFVLDISTANIIKSEVYHDYSNDFNKDFFRQLAFLEFITEEKLKIIDEDNKGERFTDVHLPTCVKIKLISLDKLLDYLKLNLCNYEAVKEFVYCDSPTNENYREYNKLNDLQKVCYLSSWIYELTNRGEAVEFDDEEVEFHYASTYSICNDILNTDDNRINYKISELEKKEDISDFINKQLIEKYFKLNLTTNILSFEFVDLSSGELAKFAFLSRLFYLFKGNIVYENWNENRDIQRNPFGEVDGFDNMVLIIDEGETFYHPEWQRKYIHELIEFINLFLEGSAIKTKNVQIIFTSNSPFLISDIPNNNVIFLGDEKDGFLEKTFAQNIHLLLAKTFFMDSGLMGGFASKKIDWVIDKLNDVNKDNINMTTKDETYHEIKFIIENIGEKILANYLYDLFNEKYKLICENEKSEILNKLKNALKEGNTELLKEYLEEAKKHNISINEIQDLL